MSTLETYSILVMSGLVVGFINTLAAGATVISMTVFMALGVPIVEASGTNRVAVLLQNITSSLTFKKQNLLDLKTSCKIAVPIILGIIIGAQFSMMVSERVFSILFSIGLVLMMLLMVLKPNSWLKESNSVVTTINYKTFIMLVLSGLYCGSVYVGVGYFFIAIFVLSLGYDLIKANALKSFIAAATAPFSLIIFMLHGQVNYKFGLIHAVGNIVGAYLAAKYAKKLGLKFIRFLLVIVMIISLIMTLYK